MTQPYIANETLMLPQISLTLSLVTSPLVFHTASRPKVVPLPHPQTLIGCPYDILLSNSRTLTYLKHSKYMTFWVTGTRQEIKRLGWAGLDGALSANTGTN